MLILYTHILYYFFNFFVYFNLFVLTFQLASVLLNLHVNKHELNWIIIMALQPFVGPWPLFQFFDLIHSRQNSLDGGSALRKASTYTQNKGTQTPIPQMGFEPTIPASEQAKIFHVLGRAATVIDSFTYTAYTGNIATRKSSVHANSTKVHIFNDPEYEKWFWAGWASVSMYVYELR
jgi:hypothetical protein